jgi:hypothetical protein
LSILWLFYAIVSSISDDARASETHLMTLSTVPKMESSLIQFGKTEREA